jgi:hypothetical protein
VLGGVAVAGQQLEVCGHTLAGHQRHVGGADTDDAVAEAGGGGEVQRAGGVGVAEVHRQRDRQRVRVADDRGLVAHGGAAGGELQGVDVIDLRRGHGQRDAAAAHLGAGIAGGAGGAGGGDHEERQGFQNCTAGMLVDEELA